ncbi:MAG: pilus assembly protein PilM [Thermoanaerobacteraceae bacterium]|nr:pilus assembly protein PilM [Thermoanaerobacteraceae bacterium]
MADIKKRLRGKYLGIDVGNTSVKIVKITPRDISKPLFRLIKTPEGSIEDGYIKDSNALKEAMAPCFKGKGRFGSSNVVFSVLSSAVIIRDIEVPVVPAKELPQLVNNMADEYIPTSLDEYIIDFRPMEIIDEGEDKRQKILLFAAPLPLIDGYLKLADSLNLKLSAIDVYQNCIIKAAEYIKDFNYNDYLILDIGGKKSVASFFYSGHFAFSRIFDFGGNNITQLISNFHNISLDEAEDLKINHPSEEINIDPSVMFEGFVGDLTRYLDYYVSRYRTEGIENVVITGGGSRFAPLSAYISESLNIEVIPINNFLPEPYMFILNAFGASIRG